MGTIREICFAVAAATSLYIEPAVASDTPRLATLKPISGDGSLPGKQAVLILPIGTKQTVSFFENQNGQCKLSLLLAEAFNGEDVPNETAVRFEAQIESSKTTVFDTADGKGLQFTCQANGQSLDVSATPENVAALR